MILTCPACGKRYRVADDAIPPQGKLVRCAACHHGWVAEAEDAAMLLVEEAPAPPLSAPPPDSGREPGGGDTDSNVGLEAPTSQNWEGSSEDGDDRARLPGWAVAAIGFALLAAALVAGWALAPRATLDAAGIPALDVARISLTAPDIAVPRVTISLPPLDLARVPLVGPTLARWFDPPAVPASPLRIEVSGERRRLANGTRLLVLTGRIVNPTNAAQAVPPIAAALVAPDGRAYRWRIDAPVAVLPAGHAAAFDSVTANWPEDAERLDLGFARR